MLNLSYDVWTHITGFIPEDELWKLRTINSAFYQAALSARYRHVDLFTSRWAPSRLLGSRAEWAATMKRWERLRQTWTGSRVRSVGCRTEHLDRYFTKWDSARISRVYTPCVSSLRLSVVGHILSWNSHKAIGEIPQWIDMPSVVFSPFDPHPFRPYTNPDLFEQYSEALAKTLTSFPVVTDYTVIQDDVPTHYHTIYVMAFVWIQFRSNLTTLTMTLPLESLHFLLLESASIHFPNLKALSLNLHSLAELDNLQRDTERLRVSVAPFINRHCQTVQSLTFTGISFTLPTLDITALLPMVNEFQTLECLEFELGVFDDRTNQISGLARFLGYHAGSLRRLRITISRHTRNFEGVEEACRKIICANLNQLATLELRYASDYFIGRVLVRKALLSSIPSVADTLTTLILDTGFQHLTFEEVQALVMAFSYRPRDQGLQVLLLAVDVLSPSLIDLLSSALPSLTKLDLIATHCLYFRPDTVEAFVADMESKEYYGWALRHISIKLSRMCNPWVGKIIAERVLDAREFWVSESTAMAWYMSRREDGTVRWRKL